MAEVQAPSLPATLATGALGYLLGSLPSARWVAARHGIDPMVAGERNPGSANVWRLVGRRAGLQVFFLDSGKGAVAAMLGLLTGGWWAACGATVAAMLGHAFPPWSGFRGGRSVACLTGGALVLAPAQAVGSWLLFFILRRPAGFSPAAATGLLSYPLLVGLFARQRQRLAGVMLAYLTLLLVWLTARRREMNPRDRKLRWP